MKTRKSLKIENISLIIACILFVCMFIAGSAVYDHFGSAATFLNLFNDNAYLIVVAVGITFVLLTGGIDISVSSVVAFTCVFSAYLLEKGWSAVIVIPLVLAVGLFNGFLIGYCVQEYRIQPFIITLASQFLLRGMCAVVSTISIPIDNAFYKEAALNKISFKFGRTNAKLYIYVFLALCIVFLAYYILKYTRFGRTVYAIGSNELSAGYMGLNVKWVKIGVYMISSFCAALGGIIFSFYTLAGYSLQNMGMELDAISSAVIGGTLLTGGVGNVLGSVVGVLIQGVIQTIVTYQNLNAWWTRVTIAALLCLFIILQRFISIRADKQKGKG
ncbi:MAG: sugar ABC transporter permease YjfF [Lachnospiraceae bacterium]|nr:sugar ABC transporter permease YjfF [Lachnospiraceae bacterium]